MENSFFMHTKLVFLKKRTIAKIGIVRFRVLKMSHANESIFYDTNFSDVPTF